MINRNSGFSLVEMLVVIFVFSILAILATQTLVLSLRGSRKSESIAEIRENVEFASGVMERRLRNAQSVNCVTNSRIDYIDENGVGDSFICDNVNDYIASGSARLTSPRTMIDCSGIVFQCSQVSGVTTSVDISLNAQDAQATGAEDASVSVTTKILLRTY
jgi:prepilin-type N-terminal cleavage/methylation domain-containing protein